MKRFLKKPTLFIACSAIIAVLLLVAIGTGTYYYIQYQRAQLLLKTPKLATQFEVESLLSKVENLIELPQNEQPTIATVSDYTKLQDQPLFKNAKNGDKVLIYAQAKKAIVYDPVENRIVQEWPINISQNQSVAGAATQSGSLTPTAAPAKIVLLNGTNIVGLTTKIGAQLESKINSIDIVEKDNARLNTYTQTYVVDLTGTATNTATQIASILNGKVTATLPQGEAKPDNADIVVILGSQK